MFRLIHTIRLVGLRGTGPRFTNNNQCGSPFVRLTRMSGGHSGLNPNVRSGSPFVRPIIIMFTDSSDSSDLEFHFKLPHRLLPPTIDQKVNSHHTSNENDNGRVVPRGSPSPLSTTSNTTAQLRMRITTARRQSSGDNLQCLHMLQWHGSPCRRGCQFSPAAYS